MRLPGKSAPSSHAAPTVSIRNVSKVFNQGQDNEVVAVRNITVDIWPNEFVSLVGLSGCGKSTLLRLIADLIRPTEGKVEVNGKSAHRARVDQDYGFVFQSATLYDWRTVTKNVQLPLEMMGYSRAERQERARRNAEIGGTGRIRAPLSLATLGRHATTRLHRPGAGLQSAHLAHG